MEDKNTTPANPKSNDLRTFLIALLTALIVVALYHFGMGFCRMFCQESACGSYRPVQRYMLVPVMESPRGYPGACGWKKQGCGPKFSGRECDRPMKSCPAPAPEGKPETPTPAGK